MGQASRLRHKEIEQAKGRAKRYWLNDGNGLYVGVYPDGIKRFFLRYTQAGKQHWMLLQDQGIETFPEVSLERARALATAAKAQLRIGIDPLQAKQAEKLEAKARQAERVAAAEALLARTTVNGLFEHWVKLELIKRKDQGKEVERSFRKDVLPLIGGMPAEAASKAHVMQILDTVLARGSNRMAKRMLSEMRQMFGFAIDRDLIAADPTARIKKDRIGGKAVMRDRHLSEEEIRELTATLPAARLLRATEIAIWIMLSTCCRVGELSTARWHDIDLAKGTWIIPTPKNGRRFVIYLSDFARQQFQALEQLKTNDTWIFPNRAGTNHIDEKTISKQVHDRQRTTPLKGRSQKTATLLLVNGAWTPHDLRRTGATLMGNLGVQPYVIERCLNHMEQNVLVRTYQHQKLIDEQIRAWQLLGERLYHLSFAEAVVATLPLRAA